MEINGNSNPKKAITIGLLGGFALFVLVLGLTKCSDSGGERNSTSPTGSSSFGQSPQTSGGVDTEAGTTGPAENPTSKDLFAVGNVDRDDHWRVELTNNSGETARVGVACYEDPDRKLETQIHSSSSTTILDAGETDSPGTPIPCGPWQCDAFTGDPIKDGPPLYGRRLILGRIGFRGGTACLPPPCPNPPCKPPVCDVEELESRANRTCEHGVKSIDTEACTFKCKPEPRCDEQELRAKAERHCEHGVKSINLNECTFKCKPEPECDNIPQRGGPFPQQGNPRAECSFFGDFVPTRSSADFYICKAGTEMFVSRSSFQGPNCPNGKEISHITKCKCDEDDDSSSSDDSSCGD